MHNMIKHTLKILTEKNYNINELKKTVSSVLDTMTDEQLTFILSSNGLKISNDLDLFFYYGVGFRCLSRTNHPVKSIIEKNLNDRLQENNSNYVGVIFKFDNNYLITRKIKRNNIPKSDKWTFPKVRINNGDVLLEAVYTEIKKEIGITIPDNFLNGLTPFRIPIITECGIMNYYVYLKEITQYEFDNIFDTNYIIMKEKLQFNEIDYAGFFTKEECFNKLDKEFLGILK